MDIQLTVKVTMKLTRQEGGDAMEREEILDEIIEALEEADPGSIGDYDVEDFTVERVVRK